MDMENDSDFKKMMDEQTDEIKKHVWIESQKAGRDLYPEAALDWIRRFSAIWRKEYEERHGK